MIGFNKFQHVNLVSWFPGVISLRVALPFDQVLEGSRPSRMLVINYLLNLVLFCSLDKVWRWSRIIGSMCCCFTIRGYE